MSSTQTQTINDRFVIDTTDDDAFIGQGGMGSVYRGVDTETGETIALKMLKPEIIRRDLDMIERFKREGEALRQLNHPNIVKMLGAGIHDEQHYIAMEYVSGGSLRSVLDEAGQLSVQRALYIALDVADALTRAHRLGILHRDIKPDNVLIADDGTPRLTDFGMARVRDETHITQDGAIVGTLSYLAPEAFDAEEADERTDIWSFGVMLYEMIAGERPFPQSQPPALINAILTRPIPDLEEVRPDAPTALVDLIYRMLTKDRQARIPSVRLVGAEIEAVMRGSSQMIQPVISPDTTGRFEAMTTTPAPRVQTSAIFTQNNLPNQPTPFVGRETELNDLQELLNQNTRLITLLGAGGMGKTRIALEFAKRQMSRFPDGVYFVPLAPLDSPEHVIHNIAEAIDFSFGSGNARADLLNYLREKRMLIVLDNFEHMMKAVDIVADILSEAPEVVLIVTSRERLRLRGEQVYDIRGMILPEKTDETPGALLAYPSVQLFMQSAHRVMPGFEIADDATAQAVAEIIRLVDGLPLGIELAAAWLEMLPIDEIIDEIKRSLDFLETNLRDVPERHRSIRAVFEYSWNLLDESERETFLKLSIFRGGFEREAAQEVAGASLRGLTTLVNKSLLRRDLEGRYFAHQLLRQYAEERFVDDATRKATYEAHAHYYARFMQKLEAVMNTRKEIAAIEAVDRELENVRLMWRNCLDGGSWDVLNSVIDTFLWFYIGRSMLQEGYDVFKELVTILDAADQNQTSFYWRARVRQAWIGARLGQYEETLQTTQQAYEHFLNEENEREINFCLIQLSYASMMLGRYEESKDYAEESVEVVSDKRENTIGYYMGMGNLGYVHYLMGNYKQARDIYETLNANVDELDYSASGHAYGKNNLGEILREIGQTRRAHTLFEEAFAIFRQINHKRGMAFTKNNIAGVAFMEGNYDAAEEMYDHAYQLNRDIGDQIGIAHSLSALGNIAIASGDNAKAEGYFQQSLAIRREIGDRRGIADSLADLARIQVERGDLESAEEKISEALRIRREIGDRQGEGVALAGRGLALAMLGEYDRARTDVEDAIRIGEELGHLFMRTQAYVARGEIALHDGDYETADHYYRKALAASDAVDARTFVLAALTGIAKVKAAHDDYVRALEIITLVLRYPRKFIAMIETRAQELLDDIVAATGDEFVDETMTRSKSLVLKQVVEELLAETGDNGDSMEKSD